jgi:hypothetical protein
MKRRVLATPVLLALALVLSSCIKLDMDMKLGKNEKMSGKVIVGVQSSMLEMMGETKDDFFKDMEKSNAKDLPKTVKVKRYDKDGFIGQEMSFKDMPASEFANLSASAKSTTGGDSESSPDDLKLVKKGDTWVFTGTLDFAGDGAASSDDADNPMAQAMMKGFKVRLKMEFPGKILERDKFAKIKGNTAEWKPKAGEKVVIRIVAKTS